MSYTTVDRIIEEYPMINSMTTVSSLSILNQISNAEAEINGRIARLYTVPVVDAPQLTAIATDFTMYRILRRVFTQERLKNSDWPASFKDASDLLKDIASGKAHLTTSSGDLVAGRTDVSQVWTNKIDYEPTFDEHGRYDQIVDPDKVEDLEDDRDLGTSRVW